VKTKPENLLYDLNQWIDVGLSAIIAIGFMFYGIRIICMRAGSDTLNPDLRKELMKVKQRNLICRDIYIVYYDLYLLIKLLAKINSENIRI
jgi:hypothetical protein